MCALMPESSRLLRFRERIANEQSALTHAQQSLLNAVQDINDAVQLARSREELRELRGTIDTTIRTLLTSSAVAETLEEFGPDR